VLSAECRVLRRVLRPLVWVTLEEVALDATPQGGRLVAPTSARQVAERLGIDPGTAAAALRVLRERGLVELEREKGPAGRFGLSVYTLRPIAGLTVVLPRAGRPRVVSPPLAQPATVSPALVGPYVDTAPPSHSASTDAEPARSVQCPGQETFDLGAGS
jgi:DNA-binding transcriptional ArsR family regulator